MIFDSPVVRSVYIQAQSGFGSFGSNNSEPYPQNWLSRRFVIASINCLVRIEFLDVSAKFEIGADPFWPYKWDKSRTYSITTLSNIMQIIILFRTISIIVMVISDKIDNTVLDLGMSS